MLPFDHVRVVRSNQIFLWQGRRCPLSGMLTHSSPPTENVKTGIASVSIFGLGKWETDFKIRTKEKFLFYEIFYIRIRNALTCGLSVLLSRSSSAC